MLDIDTRPDLRTLMLELQQYNIDYIHEDQIIVPVPYFQRNSGWYGISLSCRPNRQSVNVYICENKHDGASSFLYTIDNITGISLQDIIDESTKLAETCDKCKETYELEDMIIYNKLHVCPNCAKLLHG